MPFREFPPFGFSVWYDPRRGTWRWKERHPKGNPDDVTAGNVGSRREGIAVCRAELRRRGAREAQRAAEAEAESEKE